MPIVGYQEAIEDEFEHGLFGSTKKRKGAKYIAKIPIGKGKYRYFYSQEELRRYQMAKKASDKVKGAKDYVIDELGRKYYKKAEAYEKDLPEAEKAYNKATKKLEKIEDDAAKRALKKGLPYGMGIYNKNERKEFEKALKEHEEATVNYGDKKFRHDWNIRQGDNTLYGKTKKTEKAAKNFISKINKDIKKSDLGKEIEKGKKKIERKYKKYMYKKAVRDAVREKFGDEGVKTFNNIDKTVRKAKNKIKKKSDLNKTIEKGIKKAEWKYKKYKYKKAVRDAVRENFGDEGVKTYDNIGKNTDDIIRRVKKRLKN